MFDNRWAVQGGLGREWRFSNVSIPEPGEHELLIKVRAAGLNNNDLTMLRGAYNGNDATVPYIAGREAAGIVIARGSSVVDRDIGDKVMGATPQGGFATVAVMDARHSVHIPDGVSWAEAGALPIGLGTEHDALVTQAGFADGDRVLFLGGGTSVGLIGIRMAKALGASLVVATTSTESKVSAIRAAGADLVLNSGSKSWAEEILKATNGSGVDIVLDHLGGQPLAESLRATRVGGTIVNIGRMASHKVDLDLDDLSFRMIRLIGTTFSVRTAAARGAVYGSLEKNVMPAVASGAIRPVMDRTFPAARANDAAEYLREGRGLGKCVLIFDA